MGGKLLQNPGALAGRVVENHKNANHRLQTIGAKPRLSLTPDVRRKYMKYSAVILVAMTLSAGCATRNIDRAPWSVEIWQPEGRAIVPQNQWSDAETALFLTTDFKKEVQNLETGTRWTTDTSEWILWDLDWTNHTVIIRRNEAK